MLCLTDCNIGFIKYNSDIHQFTITTKNRVNYYEFPVFAQGCFFEFPLLSLSILKMYINDCHNNIFIINHCLPKYIKCLHKIFPKSKIIYVVHNQKWAVPLLGNKKLFESIINGSQATIIAKDLLRSIKRGYKQEVDIYKLSNAVVCLSKTTYDLVNILYKIPLNKLFLIPNGIYFEDNPGTVRYQGFRKIKKEFFGFNSEDIILIYAGRVNKCKGISVLINAFNIISRSVNNLRLIIAGDLQEFSQSAYLYNKCTSKIIFAGHLSSEELSQILQIADIGVLPSFSEQCSYWGIEMMLHKLLIVTTDGNGLLDMFQDRFNALVASINYDSDDLDFSHNLAQVLLEAIEMKNSNQDQKLRSRAFEFAIKEYSISEMKDKYCKLFNDLIINRI